MLSFPPTAMNAMRRHAQEAYPNECCGILIGELTGEPTKDDRRVTSVIACRNANADSPGSRYHIAPRELISAQKQARRDGADVIGFYHSHPDHPPQWSATDLAEAHWMGCSYVIVSVSKDSVGEAAAFILRGAAEEDKRFEEEELEVN